MAIDTLAWLFTAITTGHPNMTTISQPNRLRNRHLSPATDQLVDPSADLLERSLCQLLDDVHSVLRKPRCEATAVAATMNRLFQGLSLLRQASPPDTWQRLIEVGREHPVRQLVHQDPFTSRAFHKPRGYAGDAVMMDYIYSHEENWPRPDASPLGEAIFNYTTQAPASAGVRERRCYVASLLDRFANKRSFPEVLSVAAGHLREASLSIGLRRHRFGRFVAMDADTESCEEIHQQYGRYGVEPVVADVRRMLTGRLDLGSFDLIYTTGLYDYLAESTAQRLTANLFKLLRPGGQLVIANFLPRIPDIGYMEMYMDWHLVYRDRRQMLGLTEQLDSSSLDAIRIVAECNENVIILELNKRPG